MEEAKTYIGGSLEELLPQIRMELGPDALIVRQREGIVGGIGGFFGKKVVEVHAQRGAGAPVAAAAMPKSKPVVPPRAVVDAYDSGDLAEDDGNLMETLLAQASPFAEQLSQQLEEPLQRPEPAPAPKAKKSAPKPAPRRQALAPVGELTVVRRELLAATIPVRVADAVVSEVERSLLPFLAGSSLRDLARTALADRIKTARPGAHRRRTIAVVGLADGGRTAATADLCAGFLRGGRAVSAVSLESAREALELAELTAEDEIPFYIADSPDQAAQIHDVVGDAEILVADVPVDGRRLEWTLQLLGALEADETHLVLPATLHAADAEALVEGLQPSRIIVSGIEDPGATGVPVGLSLTHKIPVSFTSGAALAPAFADTLAELVLQ